MRRIFCLFLFLYSCPAIQLGCAQFSTLAAGYAGNYPHITELESIILGSTYPQQTLSERLSRMEIKAFGKFSTDSDLSVRTDALDEYVANTMHKKTHMATVQKNVENTQEEDTIVSQADYPHITALEQTILGQTYIDDPLKKRLERMEKKAFGVVSSSNDLSERTDALDEYTFKQVNKNLMQSNAEAENRDLPSSLHNQVDYPHITILEQTILGRTYLGEGPAARLARMEEKAFGKASTDPDLSNRTDALEVYAEKTLHKPVPAGGYDDAEESVGKPGILSKVGQTLFGLSTNNMLNPLMGGLGMTPNGTPFPGMGNGFGGVSGSNASNKRTSAQPDQQQDNQESAQVKHKEDSAIYQANPPASNARLITKVGWCEIQVFGHTFPSLHLPERLGQLNRELKFEPGKSNVQLMDDISLMIKAVQASKASHSQNTNQ